MRAAALPNGGVRLDLEAPFAAQLIQLVGTLADVEEGTPVAAGRITPKTTDPLDAWEVEEAHTQVEASASAQIIAAARTSMQLFAAGQRNATSVTFTCSAEQANALIMAAMSLYAHGLVQEGGVGRGQAGLGDTELPTNDPRRLLAGATAAMIAEALL